MRPLLLITLILLVGPASLGQNLNNSGATLMINGADPVLVPGTTVISDPSFDLTVSGAAVGAPYRIGVSANVAPCGFAGGVGGTLGSTVGCSQAPGFYSVDIGTFPGYTDVTFAIDGLAPGFLNQLAVLDPVTGSSSWTFPVPSGVTIPVLTHLQILVLDATEPLGLALSAAASLGVMSNPACPAGATQIDGTALNWSTSVALSGWSFPFFGVSYTTLFVNENGNITFGGSSSDSSESINELLGVSGSGNGCGLPRIAVLWDDLRTANSASLGSGSVWGFEDTTAQTYTVCWEGVADVIPYTPNTVRCTLDFAGGINVTWSAGQPGSPDCIVGISPGSVVAGACGSGPLSANLAPMDLSATPLPFIAAGPTDAIFEQFTYLGLSNPLDLKGFIGAGGPGLSFAGTGGPGIGPYSMF